MHLLSRDGTSSLRDAADLFLLRVRSSSLARDGSSSLRDMADLLLLRATADHSSSLWRNRVDEYTEKILRGCRPW